MTKTVIKDTKANIKILAKVTSIINNKKFITRHKASASLSKYDYNIEEAMQNAKYDANFQHLKAGGKSGAFVEIIDYNIIYAGQTNTRELEFKQDPRTGQFIATSKKVKRDGFLVIKRESKKIKAKRIKENGKYKTIKYFIEEKTKRKIILSIDEYNRGDIKKLNKKFKKTNKYVLVSREVKSNKILTASIWTNKIYF